MSYSINLLITEVFGEKSQVSPGSAKKILVIVFLKANTLQQFIIVNPKLNFCQGNQQHKYFICLNLIFRYIVFCPTVQKFHQFSITKPNKSQPLHDNIEKNGTYCNSLCDLPRNMNLSTLSSPVLSWVSLQKGESVKEKTKKREKKYPKLKKRKFSLISRTIYIYLYIFYIYAPSPAGHSGRR